MSDIAKYCHREIGIALSVLAIGGANSQEIAFQPQVTTVDYYCDTVNWMEISNTFTATGGENFLTIGLFHNDSSADTHVLNASSPEICAYYLIDNVSLTEFVFPELPNVFTPNDDGINDVWEIELSEGYEVTVVNRWGDIVMNVLSTTTPVRWDGKATNGTQCQEGNYFYVIKKEQLNKTGFIQLIR